MTSYVNWMRLRKGSFEISAKVRIFFNFLKLKVGEMYNFKPTIIKTETDHTF